MLGPLQVRMCIYHEVAGCAPSDARCAVSCANAARVPEAGFPPLTTFNYLKLHLTPSIRYSV